MRRRNDAAKIRCLRHENRRQNRKSKKSSEYSRKVEALPEHSFTGRNSGGCEATWDGWQCFEAASANTNVTKECPVYIYGDYIKIPEFDNCRRFSGFVLSKSGTRFFSRPEKMRRERVEQAAGPRIHGLFSMFSVESRRGRAETDRRHRGLLDFCGIPSARCVPAIFIEVRKFAVLVWLKSFRRIREQPMFTLHRHLLISFLFYGIFYLVNVLIFIVEDAPLSIFVFTNNVSFKIW